MQQLTSQPPRCQLGLLCRLLLYRNRIPLRSQSIGSICCINFGLEQWDPSAHATHKEILCSVLASTCMLLKDMLHPLCQFKTATQSEYCWTSHQVSVIMRSNRLQECLILLGTKLLPFLLKLVHPPVKLIHGIIEMHPPHPWNGACLAHSA